MTTPRKKNGSIDWDDLYAKGENPNGMMAQTADETVRNCEALSPQEYKYHQEADGKRWNSGFAPEPTDFGIPASAPRRRRR